jgi:hypothetical protein
VRQRRHRTRIGTGPRGRSKDRGEDRDGDEGGGEDVAVPSIYSSKMKK